MPTPKKSERIDLDILRNHLDNLDLRNADNLNFWLYCKIAMRTGLRSVDILKLRVKDIKFSNGTATVIEQKTKKKIIVPIDRTIMAQIDMDQDYVIWNNKYSTPVSLMTVNRRLKKIFKDGETNVSSHSIRKSCAQIVYEKSGKDIIEAMLFLNHSNTNTTISYMGLNEEKRFATYSYLD